MSQDIKEIANKNFVLWNEALQTRDAKKVAALYTLDATFLPTVSGEFKKGQLGAEEYFQHFLQKNPVGKIIADEVQALGADYYLHSGMYNFEVGLEEKREAVKARFSFIWQCDNQGSWKILHHHSSVKPIV